MPDLLDANVWVALSVEGHVHHSRAVDFAQAEASEELAFCRVTELAVLRLVSSPLVVGEPAIDGRIVWIALQTLQADSRVVRLDEPAVIDEVLGAWTAGLDIRGRHWTDAYLAAFAVASGCRFVTFDSDFARFPDLSWLHLQP